MNKDLKNTFLAVLGIIVVCLIGYYDILSHDFLIDDVQFIAPEQFLPSRSLAYYLFHTPSMHFSPLYYIVNLLAYELLNRDPVALHVINIVLHGINAALFFFFVKMIEPRPGIALAATTAFLLLPVNSFTISYVPANTIFLSSMWTLLCLIYFCRYVQNGKRRWLPASYGFFFLGLLHFEGALLVPLYILGILWLIEKKPFKPLLKDIAPYLLVAAAYMSLWFIAASANAPIAGKLGAHNISPVEYLASYSRLAFWYLGKLFFPEGVVYIYNLPAGSGSLLFLAAAAAAIIGCVWILARKRNAASFALLWLMSGFLLAFPAIATHYNAMGFVFEAHWLYFNSMGFCLLLAFGFMATRKFFEPRSFAIIGTGLFLYLFIMTKYINALSQNEERYYEYWLRASPGNAIARENLASLYIYDENTSVDPELIDEMRLQVRNYEKAGNITNAALLTIRIETSSLL